MYNYLKLYEPRSRYLETLSIDPSDGINCCSPDLQDATKCMALCCNHLPLSPIVTLLHHFNLLNHYYTPLSTASLRHICSWSSLYLVVKLLTIHSQTSFARCNFDNFLRSQRVYYSKSEVNRIKQFMRIDVKFRRFARRHGRRVTMVQLQSFDLNTLYTKLGIPSLEGKKNREDEIVKDLADTKLRDALYRRYQDVQSDEDLDDM